MKRKIIMALMVACILSLLCACGDKKQEKGKEEKEVSEQTGERIPEGAVYSRVVGTEETINGPRDKRKEYVGNGKDVYFPSGVKDNDRFTLGDYEYTYSEEYINFEGKTYEGWFGYPLEEKATYETALESINGHPVIGLNIANDLMTETPVLPDSILFMNCMFENCKNLKVVTNIPSSVISMLGAFSGCTNLVQVPDLPEGVKNIGGAFQRCSSLKKAPLIPSSVTNMGRTFAECISLTGVVEIQATPSYYNDCFDDICNPIILKGDCTIKEELAGQVWNGMITVE